MSTTDTSRGNSPLPKSERVGQSILARIGGGEVAIECTGDDGRRVTWRAADGRAEGGMDARHWDINRRRQEGGDGG